LHPYQKRKSPVAKGVVITVPNLIDTGHCHPGEEASPVVIMVAKASPIYKENRRRSADNNSETQEGDEEFVTVRWLIPTQICPQAAYSSQAHARHDIRLSAKACATPSLSNPTGLDPASSQKRMD